MVIFSTNKKNTEKCGKKNCLQEDDDGIKYVCGDIYVKKNVSRRFMTLVMTPTFTLKQSFLPRLRSQPCEISNLQDRLPFPPVHFSASSSSLMHGNVWSVTKVFIIHEKKNNNNNNNKLLNAQSAVLILHFFIILTDREWIVHERASFSPKSQI